MSVPAILSKLRLPVIAAPLFIISNPKLVIAQCKAGVTTLRGRGLFNDGEAFHA